MKDTIWRLVADLCTRPAVLNWIERRAQRTPYFDIHNSGKLYMRRWWLMPRWALKHDPDVGALMPKKWMPFSIRVHHIVLPDPDRHLHDHPFNFRSILLRGGYMEQTEESGPVRPILPGDTYRSPAGRYHRIAVVSEGGVWSLFIMGRRVNDWGFLVDGEKVPWQQYLAERGPQP